LQALWGYLKLDYQRSKHHVFLLNYHLVWCPKRRRKVLIGNVESRLKQIIGEVANELSIQVLALEVMPDHLHLFVSSRPELSLTHIVKAIKGRSSRVLREEFPELQRMPSLWTHSYFVSTAGNVSADTIKKYIEEQKTRD
jgi:putative transposase